MKFERSAGINQETLRERFPSIKVAHSIKDHQTGNSVFELAAESGVWRHAFKADEDGPFWQGDLAIAPAK